MRDVRDMERFAKMIESHQMVIEEIFAERKRQVESEGWTLEHDDEHTRGELADAAACYAATKPPRFMIAARNQTFSLWPWDQEWWKPSARRHDLVKAAALIVAEIERLDRSALSPAQVGEK